VSRLKLLITGGGGSGAEAINRLWAERYELHFADADLTALSPSLPAARSHAIPMAGPSWPHAIADICRSAAVDVLVPCVDEELPYVPEVVRSCPNLIPLLPSADFVRLMKDKLGSMEAMAKAGIDAPHTVGILSAEKIGFPCLVKPRDGRGSRGVQIVKNKAQLDAYLTLTDRAAEDLVAQELLLGQEWTVYVSADRDANLRAVIPMRVDLKKGITIRAQTQTNEAIATYCQALHARFPTPGPYNVQLIEQADGRIAAFEINPRVSTTLCLAIAAGADPVADFSDRHPAAALSPFRTGVRLRRNWLNNIE
jgi:carbamoyl-phosphate synthase large subunit